jgi:spermidine synthase/MFS family permease
LVEGEMTKLLDRATFAVALLLFFGSGAVSLVYQTLWVSWFVHVFGGSSQAISAVLAAFMAGLGLGAWLLGRYADRKFDRLVGYGLLEIGIGAYALLLGGIERIGLPRVTDLFKPVYAAIYNFDPDATGLLTAARFVISFIVLLPVTTMMGATLPMLSKHLVARLDGVGARVGRLYSWNTFGAVAGTLAAGFYLIEHFGRDKANTYCAAINFLIGAVALVWSATFSEEEKPAGSEEKTASSGRERSGDSRPPLAEESGSPELPRAWLLVMLVCFGVSGAVAMVYEVAWSRLTGLLLGSSNYSFTVMLATFLVGIAGGSSLAGRWLAGSTVGLSTFAWVQLGVGAGTALVLWFGEYLPVVFLWLLPLRQMVNPDYLTLTYVHGQVIAIGVCVAMMALPALMLGACFPVAVQVYTRNIEKLGAGIGVVYGSNTAGSVIGSAAAGFLLLPNLGLYATMAAGCVVNLLLTAVLAAGALAAGPVRSRTSAAVALAVSLAMAVGAALAPAWDPLLMNAGLFQYGGKEERSIVLRHGLTGLRRGLAGLKATLRSQYALAYVRDGLNSSVTVMANPGEAARRAFEQLMSDPAKAASVRGKLRAGLEARLAKLPAPAENVDDVENARRREARKSLEEDIVSVTTGPDAAVTNRLRVLVDEVRETGRTSGSPSPEGPFENDILQIVCRITEADGREVLAEETVEGPRGVIAGGRHLRNNGKVDASDVGDMATQLMVAYLPVLAHPNPESVCVIGLGSGTTVGAVEQFAGVKEIHCVELESAVVEGARRHFSHRHRDFASDPRYRLFAHDGRNHLSLSDRQYDVIINEPSNPWIAGIANLFTREFYRDAKKRLKPGGILCQWCQLYAVDWSDYLMMLRTLRSEFKHVVVFKVDPRDTADTMVLATDDAEIVFDPVRMQGIVDSPDHLRLRADLGKWLVPDMMSLLHAVYLLGPRDVDGLLDGWSRRGPDDEPDRYDRLNTDDRPLLEYSAPRSLHYGDHQKEIVGRLWDARSRRRSEVLVGTGTGALPLASALTDWPALADFPAAVGRADAGRLAAEVFAGAQRYLRSGDLDHAEDAAEDLLRLRPGSVSGLYLSGKIAQKRSGGRYSPWRAKELFARAASAGRTDEWLHEDLRDFGNDLDNLKRRVEERIALLDDMLREMPEWPTGYLLYGDLLAGATDDAASSARSLQCWRRARDLILEGLPGPGPSEASVRRQFAAILMRMAVNNPLVDGPPSLAALAKLNGQ